MSSAACCGLRRSEKPKKLNVWKFSNGTTVYADTFEDAMKEMKSVNPKNFWASETIEGVWDVQLSDAVVFYSLQAKTVLEAVKSARWKLYLDTSIKKVASFNQ